MRVLVTAGPTREYIDDIRFISNGSSGRAGYEIARELARAGHIVTLLSGPTAIEPPDGVKFVGVLSAEELERESLRLFRRIDAVVMAAAVGDYRPAHRYNGKLKKHAATLRLLLRRTPDILSRMGRRKGGRILIGFALESQNPVRNAMEKLRRKRLDYIVLNGPATLGAAASDFLVIHNSGVSAWHRGIAKRTLGKIIAALLAKASKE